MRLSFMLCWIFFLVACHPRPGDTGGTTSSPGTEEKQEDTITFTPPKNIILMIGDGMGITQISAGMYLNGNRLNLEQFEFVGLQKTYASNDLITDSAAGATALATGVKTYNGAIGVDKRGAPVRTILEEAEAAGKSTGIIVTSSLTHATPASFFAHKKNRSQVEEIAAALPGVGIDFFVGGGRQHFVQRPDGKNLIQDLLQRDYVLSDYQQADFKEATIDFDKKFGYFTAAEAPPTASQGRDYLAPASSAAASFLTAKGKGFFLMVASSQMDWAGEANDAGYITSEMIDFDKAVGAVVDFARQDGQTLVLVTASHETGGFAINPGSRMDSIVPAFTGTKPTGVLIPVFAFGPGAELFAGIYENTGIYDRMKKAFGLKQ